MNDRRAAVLLGVLLLAYGLLAVALPSHAQHGQSTEAVRQLERRVDNLDAQRFGERIARMEALMEAAKAQGERTFQFVLACFSSLIAIIAERVWSATRPPEARKERAMRMGD